VFYESKSVRQEASRSFPGEGRHLLRVAHAEGLWTSSSTAAPPTYLVAMPRRSERTDLPLWRDHEAQERLAEG